MMNKLNKKKKKGFTLIELIIVIAILAILAAVAVPQFGKVRENANKSTDISNAKTIANAVSTLLAEDKLVLPTTDAGAEFILDESADADANYGGMKAVVNGSEVDGVEIEKAITGYIQSLPKAKLAMYRDTHYTIKVSKDSKIIVQVTKNSSTSQVYPDPSPATGSLYY